MRQKYSKTLFEATTPLTLRIDGLHSIEEARKVRQALRMLNGVAKAEVREQEGLVEIQYVPERVDVPTLIATIGGLGFSARQQ